MGDNIVKLEFNESIEKSFKIYLKVNATVQKDLKIGEYINHMGIKVPIISKFNGKLLKIDLEEKQIIIEKCKHEMIYMSLCTSCGKKVTKSSQPYISIHSHITFSEEKTKLEEESIVQKYLSSQKLILLLDIDNTILHASSFSLSDEEYSAMKKTYDWEVTFVTISSDENFRSQEKIFLKFRPKLKEFLESIKEKYEIFIYTHGTKNYAEEIIKYLNKSLNYQYFSNQRLVARSGTNCENKSIKKIFPTTKDMVVILDDRTDVWCENSHLINLTGYYFFYDERNYRIKSKFKNEDEDLILFSITHILLFVNKYFYHHYTNFQKKIDTMLIIKHKFLGILQGQKFIISGYNNVTDIYNTRINFLIDALGGQLLLHYDDYIDIVIVREYKSNDTIKRAEEEKKLILHESWLDFCAFFFVKIKYDDFILSEQTPIIENSKLRMKHVFENNKDTILDYYSTTEDKLNVFF